MNCNTKPNMITELIRFEKQYNDKGIRYVGKYQGMPVFPHRNWPMNVPLRSLDGNWLLVTFEVREGNTYAFFMPVNNANEVEEEIGAIERSLNGNPPGTEMQSMLDGLRTQLKLHCSNEE